MVFLSFNILSINAIVPIYDKSGGNFTSLVIDGYSTTIKNRTDTVISNICKDISIDYNLLKTTYSKLINKQLIVSIPLNSKLTLVPFKARIPIGRKDGAFGYYRLEHIHSYSINKPGVCIVNLVNNYGSFEVFEHYETIKQRINQAIAISLYHNESTNGLLSHQLFVDPYMPRNI